MSVQINGINAIDDDRNFSAAGIVTVGTGNSATIIDGTTGITSIGIGITMEGVSGNISIAGTLTAAGFSVPPTPVSFSPADGATEQTVFTDIAITFDQYITGFATDKNITVRDSSGIGTVLQTIAADSGAATINGATVTINPPSNFPPSTDIYIVVDEGAFLGAYSAPSPLIDTYNFSTEAVKLGDPYEGGYLICQSGGTRWVVAPSSAEVSRNWYSRGDSVARAQQVSGCSGWFVPSDGTYQNPGYICRTYWDSYSSTTYWSSGEHNEDFGRFVDFTNGTVCFWDKQGSRCVRAFRTVSY